MKTRICLVLYRSSFRTIMSLNCIFDSSDHHFRKRLYFFSKWLRSRINLSEAIFHSSIGIRQKAGNLNFLENEDPHRILIIAANADALKNSSVSPRAVAKNIQSNPSRIDRFILPFSACGMAFQPSSQRALINFLPDCVL